MSRKKDDFEAMADALLGGSVTLQAVPLLRPEGRTIPALTGTVEGFVGIGIAGVAARTAFGMVKAPHKGFAKKTKKNHGR